MMQDDPNTPGWLPGAPAPWLDAYGPAPGELAPIDQLASTLGPRGTESTIDPIPPPPPPPPPTDGGGTGTGRKGGQASHHLGEGGPQAQEEIASTPLARPSPAPSAEFGAGSVPPPWLADMQQHAQVAGGPAAFVPPWLQQAGAKQAPDAISGATSPPPDAKSPDQALALIAVDPSAPLADRQKAWQDMAPEQRTVLVNNADPKALAAIATADMDPKDLAVIAVRHQQAQIHEESAQALELARKRDEQAAADWQMQQAAYQQANAKTAQLEADARVLAQQKIDPNEHGVGHFIASVLLSAIGGAVSQYTGGRNLALEEFDKQTQRRIDAQHQNIQNGFQAIGLKRNLIAEQLQRSGDLYHATTAYHVAQYDRAISELETKRQDYDQQGTTNMRAVGAIQQAQAQRAALLQAYNQQAFKNSIEASKDLRENMLAASTILKNKAETDKLRAAGAAAPAAKILPVEYFTGLGLVAPPAPMSVDAYKDWLALSKSGAETSKAQQDAASNAAATVVSKPHGDFGPVLDASGKPVRIAADVAKELNEQNASAQNVVSDLNDVKRMLEEDPSTVDRKTWAEIQARIGQSLPAIAGYYKSKFSSKEEQAIKDITNLDFDSYVRRLKDKGTAVASIDAIVDTVKRSVDTTNSTTLHTPVAGTLSDVGSAPKPKPTEVDQILSKLSTSPHEDDSGDAKPPPRDPEFAATLAQQREINRPKPSGPGRKDQDALLDRAAMFAMSRVAQIKGRWYLVDDSGDEIKGVDPVDTEAAGAVLLRKYRDAARAGLAKLAGDAEDKTVRERAGAVVQALSVPEVDAP